VRKDTEENMMQLSRPTRVLYGIVAVAATLLTSAFAVPMFSANAACAQEDDEECNDLAGCLPEGVTMEGCWECETSTEGWWTLQVTIVCTQTSDATDSGTITIRTERNVFGAVWDYLFGDNCLE